MAQDECLPSVLLTLLLSTPFFIFYVHNFLSWVENRSELVPIYDPVLARLPTRDTSWPIVVFSLSTLLFIWSDFTWSRVVLCCWTMVFTLGVRCIFLIVCPLKVHPNHIVLNDRFIEFITGHRANHARPYVNDLFMSGHCSWHLVVSHVFPEHAAIKWVLFFGLACCLLLCKAHYTIDVLIPPFVVPHTFALAQSFVTNVFGSCS